MTTSTENKPSDLATATATVVAAIIQTGNVPQNEVPDLLKDTARHIHEAVLQADQEPYVEPPPPVPAVDPKESVFPDYIVCLEDGKKLKMIRRHLAATYNMTPEEYRTKWGLPADYPMVAPNYKERRSMIAKSVGLGRVPVRKKDQAETGSTASSEAVDDKAPAKSETPTPAKRGRKKAEKPASKD